MNELRMISDILSKAQIKRSSFTLLFFWAAVSSLLEVLPSELLGKLSDILMSFPVGKEMSILSKWSITFFLIVTIGAIVRNSFCYATSKCANTIIKNIREQAFLKLLTVDYSRLENSDSGYCINMVNGNTSRLETVFSVALFTLISDVFDFLWISAFICVVDWKLLLILLVFMPPLFLLGIHSSKYQRTQSKMRIGIETDIIRSIRSAFTNLPAIRLFNGYNRECESFNSYCSQYQNVSNSADVALSIFFVLEKTIRYIAISIVVLITARGIVNEKYEFGSLVTIVLYSQRFYSPITNIIRYFQMLQKGMASAEALCTFLDAEDVDLFNNITFTESEPFVSFEDVTVRIDGKTLLSQTNLNLQDRTLNIIYGESGTGKTTLLRAMLGLIPLSSGTIRINSALRSSNIFSYASQDTEIFSGTVLDNILYPDTSVSVSNEKMIHAKDLLYKLGFQEEKWYHNVGELGCNLSGGEKKRIAFARAVLYSSQILVLDEITSNLDKENVSTINEIILGQCENRCVVLITHQDFTAKKDTIIHSLEKDE